MKTQHTHIVHLLHCLDLEEKEQIHRYQSSEQNSLKALKSEGLAIHPIRITRKFFGYADYPEFGFRIPFPIDAPNFKDGVAIECFCQGETPIKGIVISLDGKSGEIRLFAPDFPDWIEDENVGIKLSPDTRTTNLMRKAINEIEQSPRLYNLFNSIHSAAHISPVQTKNNFNQVDWKNKRLNDSQKDAVLAMLHEKEVTIIHGPPGTGKTTTLVEGILQLAKNGEKIIVTAPSNTAVDTLAKELMDKNVNFLRVGNNAKVDDSIYSYTVEGKLIHNKQDKEIKKLRIRAAEMRKMAGQYKRRFGKDEREQRGLLLKEVKSIRSEIKQLQRYNEEKLYDAAQIILGTPIGLQEDQIKKIEFQTVIIDEAGQCLEPLAWCVIPLAKKLILAGDHLQLPPTVLAEKAIKIGFNSSILEQCFDKFPAMYFLNTQYRMRQPIAAFSNLYFYNGKLITPPELAANQEHIVFYDTVGAGYEEEAGTDGNSIVNKGEIEFIEKLIEKDGINLEKTVLISPYSGQVMCAKETLPKELKCSTIDSFQGQEKNTIIVSLVRSNNHGNIGFLKDYRRMNVAMTRAKSKLYLVGDSSTLSNDPFYSKLLDFLESIHAYKSVWEIL